MPSRKDDQMARRISTRGRSTRSQSRTRRADLPTTAPLSARSAPSGVGRETFAVARATRQLQSEVPSLVYVPKANKSLKLSASVQNKSETKTTPISKVGVVTPKKGNLTIQKDQVNNCKSKPDGSRSKGGSRPFVKWCK